MNKKQENLIKAITIIDYVFAAIFIFVAALSLLGGSVLASIGGSSMISNFLPKGILSGMIGGILIVLALGLATLGVLYFYLAKGIASKKYWAKVVQIIVAIIVHLFSFPIGTAVAAFELYVLLINEKTKNVFKK